MDILFTPSFRAHVEELMERHHVPGLSIALVRDQRRESAGYGMASLNPPQRCTGDTLFDIASSSKSLTAASVALLVDDNENYPEVQYDATMSSLLPDDFVMQGDGYTESVTIDDVLSHRTGIGRHDDSYLGVRAAQPDSPRSVTRNLRNLSVAAPIRSKYIYCNMMFTVAVHLVEVKSGMPFSDFLHKHFFGPLEMLSSHLQPERARASGLNERIAAGHLWDDDAKSYRQFQTPDCPEANGAGSIMTSANDYIRWVKALLNQQGPINERVYKGLLRPRIVANPDEDDLDPNTSFITYAAGLEVTFYRGHKIVAHDGCVAGFASTHFFLPEIMFGGVILGNSDSATAVVDILARELIDEFLHVPQDDRPNWSEIITRREDNNDDDSKAKAEKIKQQFRPGITEPEVQELPLSAYTGQYWHPGYHGMNIQVENNQLFIDARDRSFGFTLTFEHVCEQTKYIAHETGFLDGEGGVFRAEFTLENNKATRLGLLLDDDFDEVIWFDKIQQA